MRTKIYEDVFDEARLEVIGPSGVMIHGTRPGVSYQNAHRSLLVVSKQIRQEARPIFMAGTVIVIHDGGYSKLKQAWRVRVAGPQLRLTTASLVGWMPPGEVEAYSKSTTVRLRITTLAISQYNWQWFSLKHFCSLQVFEVKVDGGSSVVQFRQDEGGVDDPPDAEKVAACKGMTVCQWAEERVYASVGGREKLVETLKIAPSVDLRTSMMLHTISNKPSESKFVGRWVIHIEKRTFQKAIHPRRYSRRMRNDEDWLNW